MPALLADLLEEPRRRRAAEDRVEERGGEPPPVRARDAGRAEADVVLLGVLALETQPGRRRLDERRPDVRGASRDLAAALERLRDELDEPLVLDVAGGRDHDVPRACTSRRGSRRSRRAGSTRSPRRCRSPAARADGRRRPPRRSGRARAPAACPRTSRSPRARPRARRRAPRRRREDHVAHHVERRLEVVVGHAGVDERVLARRRGVQLAAQPVEDLRDLERVEALVPLKSRCSMKCVTPACARSRPASRRRSSSRRRPSGHGRDARGSPVRRSRAR